MLISLDVKSFDRHGFPWLPSTKHIYNIDNNIYKKSTFVPPWAFFVCTKLRLVNQPLNNCSSFLLFPARQSKPTQLKLLGVCVCRCVKTGFKRNCFLQISTMCNESSCRLLPSPSSSIGIPKFSAHEGILILQLFKFFDLLS